MLFRSVGSYEDVALKIKEIKSMGALGVVVSDLALVEHDRKNVHIVMSSI